MAAIAAIVIALIVGGLATPSMHVAARSIITPVPVDEAWKAVRDSAEHGTISFAVKEEGAPSRLVADRLDDSQQPDGTWTWVLQPEGSGTRVTVTQRARIGNPIARFLATYVGHTRQVDGYLHTLGSQLGALPQSIAAATPSD